MRPTNRIACCKLRSSVLLDVDVFTQNQVKRVTMKWDVMKQQHQARKQLALPGLHHERHNDLEQKNLFFRLSLSLSQEREQQSPSASQTSFANFNSWTLQNRVTTKYNAASLGATCSNLLPSTLMQHHFCVVLSWSPVTKRAAGLQSH